MPTFCVSASECLLPIAAKYRFDTPAIIWNLPGNAVLKCCHPVKVFRIAIEDEDGNRLANMPYRLHVENSIYRGYTDGQGLLSQEVAGDVEVGEMHVEGHTWPILIGHLKPVENTPNSGVSEREIHQPENFVQ